MEVFTISRLKHNKSEQNTSTLAHYNYPTFHHQPRHPKGTKISSTNELINLQALKHSKSQIKRNPKGNSTVNAVISYEPRIEHSYLRQIVLS